MSVYSSFEPITNRMEKLAPLLTAMLVVLATGELPVAEQDHSTAFYAPVQEEPTERARSSVQKNPEHCGHPKKPRLIVPLAKRYSDLVWIRGSEARTFVSFHAPFSPLRFIHNNLDLRTWTAAETSHLVRMQVMPSTVQGAMAMAMADGNSRLADGLLAARPTKSLYALDSRVSASCGHISRALVSRLWRFPGDADAIWYAVRDEAERCRQLQRAARTDAEASLTDAQRLWLSRMRDNRRVA